MNQCNTIIFGKRSFQKNNEMYVNEVDLEIPHGEDYKIALEELKKITNCQIHGIDFLNYFQFGEDSFWWFIFPNIIPVYKKVINFIISFQSLLDKTHPRNIIVEDDFDKLNLIEQICIKNKIKLSYSKLKLSKFLIKQKLIKKFQKTRYAKITNSKIKRRKDLFRINEKSQISLENKIAFAIPTIYRRKIFDYAIGKSKSGEYIQQSLMNLIKNETIIGIDIDYTFKGNFEKSIERLDDSISWIPIESLILEKKSKSKNLFLEKYHKLLDDKEFQKLFLFDDIELWESIEETFQKMSFAPNLPFYVTLVESLLEYFKTNSPKAIFLPYETGPYALSIIIASKNTNIKTIGVSHGFIAKYFPMYSHYCCKSTDKMLGHPIPDTTLVFGDFAKQILVDAGYPSDQVVPFGNPAFFNLEKLQESLHKSQPKTKYNINNNQTVILFTSGKLQPKYVAHGSYDYDVQIWNKLIEKFANDENYFLILKPHPQEVDTTVYQKIIEKFKAKNTLILNGDLFELLFISDIVISVYSTTMIDALCFDKPVIQVKFKDEIHPIPFEQYGAVLTTKVDTLPSKILSILNDSEIKRAISKNLSKFLLEQYGLPEHNPEDKLQSVLK